MAPWGFLATLISAILSVMWPIIALSPLRSRSWVTLPGKVNFYLFYSSDLFPYCDFSSMVEPAWAHVANVKGIQAMAITGGRVPCLGVMKQNRGDQSTAPL